MAAASGSKGEGPAAMRSAFTKTGSPASNGRNSRANVVFPAPFGPAMMTTFLTSLTRLSYWLGRRAVAGPEGTARGANLTRSHPGSLCFEDRRKEDQRGDHRSQRDWGAYQGL